MSEAGLRVLTGIIGAPIVLAGVYLGGWPLGILLIFVAGIGQYEIYQLLRRDGLEPAVGFGYIIGGSIILVPLWPSAAGIAALGLLLLLGWMPFREHGRPLRALGATVLGAVYPPLLLVSVLYLREEASVPLGNREAFALTATVLVLIWAADIGAYYVGKRWGKRALAPRVSPNKTWEGLLGGTVAALLVAGGGRLVGLEFLSWTHLLVVAVLCAICSPVGDLLESRLKRSVDVKDSGSLLPGHGGIMDRIDGLVFSFPVVVLYIRLFAGL